MGEAMARRQTASSEAPALVWFRQDLRLHDHAALHAALASGRPVLPVFVLDETTPGRWAPGGASRWWLHGSLAALAEALDTLGAPLVLRRGPWHEAIPRLVEETGAAALHAGILHEPWARRADRAVEAALDGRGVQTHWHRTATLFDLDAVRTRSGGVHAVYTPFARACRSLPPPPRPLPARRHLVAAAAPAVDRPEDWDLLPTHPDWAGGLRATWRPGEAGAAARLRGFQREGLDAYDRRRNQPGTDGTSMLSPHLHWGEISPGQVWHAAAHAADHAADRGGTGPDRFLAELLWREFAAYLLWHHPHMPEQPLRPAYANLPFRHDRRGLRAWQRGLTGVPIVDAGMRQLWQTGWMHNRVRMITASFLIKHQLIDWREGEAWFWDTLVDADLASNSAGWQWVAGSGVDSAPFFRVFNPATQGARFDPDGAYVRAFVPEIAGLPDTHLHAPWTAPPLVLEAAGVMLGRTYPHPVVDLDLGRRRALAAWENTVRGAA